jgi:hypothetical protein
MLRGGPPRLYNEDQKGGYRDERLSNRQLRHGEDFGGSETASYLPAHQRYAGRFFEHLTSLVPSFWNELPTTVEIVFVSALYGILYWDEATQDYDCHFADYTDDLRRRRVKDIWADTLTAALSEFLRQETHSQRPITTVYDLLSESAYQASFAWEKIQGAAVYHRVFKDVAGPDVLTRLAQVLAEGINGFAERTYRQGWYRVGDNAEGFGLESTVGEDRFATREGDVDKVRGQLAAQQPWLNRLPKPLSEAIVLAEASWRKVQDLPIYEWGGVAVSFIKPVERQLKDVRHLKGRETLGDVLHDIRSARGWTAIYPQVQQLNDLFIRGKHLAEPALSRAEVPTVRYLAFEILRFGLAGC